MGMYISRIYRSLEEEIKEIELPQDLDSPSNDDLLREMKELLCRRRPSRREDFEPRLSNE
ncbi:MAG: hypothetical protein HQ511_10005 [Rhodospirillales bacterium]|nr:hypothetical protein [Rhodospirillales bacterium]